MQISIYNIIISYSIVSVKFSLLLFILPRKIFNLKSKMSSNSKPYGTRSSKKADVASVSTKGKQRPAKADKVADSGKVVRKRKSLSSSKVVNPLLISAADSSDSESDSSSASASHAAKRLAKAGVADVATEKKRREDEEAARKDKMMAVVSSKLADLNDDGLMTLSELNAMASPSSIMPVFPKIASHSNLDIGPLIVDSLRIIAARPNAAIFHDAIEGVVKDIGEGSLVFLAKSVSVEVPGPTVASSSSSTDPPVPAVKKDVIVVEVYQFFSAPDPCSSVRLGRVVATNGRSPRGALGSSVGSSSSTGMMDPSEFISVLFGMDQKVYMVSLPNWQCLLQMLGHGGFRALPDIVNGVWTDPFKEKVPDKLGGVPDRMSDEDSHDSDSEVDDGLVGAESVAALGDVCFHSNKLSLTAPSANQISFGLPEQHHLTSVASLSLANRLSKPKKANEDTHTLTLGKSTNLFKLSYLGMADLVAEAVSYVPSVALSNNINDVASQIFDRIRAPICTVFLVSMVRSWSLSFHPTSLFNFIPLVIHKGTLNSEIALRKFEQFSKVDGDLDPEYSKLIDEHRIPQSNITISMLELAMQNYFLCIFILWEMRLDIQDEMLRSVQRLFDWLREHSVSSDNLAMIQFCLCACVEFLRDWDRFRRLCREVTYEGMATFLQREGPAIPSLGPQSMISNLYVRFSLNDSSFPLASLISSVSDKAAKAVATIAGPGPVTPNPRKAAKRLQNKNNKAARALLNATIPVVSNPAVTQAVTASSAVVPTTKSDVCSWFFSTDGCQFGVNCRRLHGAAPVKGSPDWIKAEAFMKKQKLTPTVEFSQ